MKKKIFIILIFSTSFTSECFSMNWNIEKQRNHRRLYINSTDTIKNVHSYQQGQILLHLSFPYINSFHFTPLNESTKNNIGFMGYSIGFDCCYNTNQYVSISISKIMDYYIPIAFVDKWKEYELMSSDYLISLSNNYKVNRFSLGYGFFFAKNNWEIINHSWNVNSSTREPISKTNNALGFIFSSYFHTYGTFCIGMVYRPTFISLGNKPSIEYEHSISIDFAWKIPLKKRITTVNR